MCLAAATSIRRGSWGTLDRSFPDAKVPAEVSRKSQEDDSTHSKLKSASRYRAGRREVIPDQDTLRAGCYPNALVHEVVRLE